LVKAAGINCSLFDFDALSFDEFKPKPNIATGESILYRGWMLSPENYKKLARLIEGKGGIPITSFENYIMCHHIIGWYEQCKIYTAETHFFPNDGNLKDNISSLGWESYFIKDFVKSNYTDRGSIASSPDEAIEIVKLIEKYRGEIEGGIAVRRVENYLKDTETRYFVMNGKVYSPNKMIFELLEKIAEIIDAPFYSVDVIQRADGEFRVVEIGDGQVSDKKMWNVKDISKMLIENA
jgi:hypothetical protein